MKKLFALVLAVMMAFSCALAEEINCYYFDPAFVEGVDGYFAAIGGFGYQMFIPENFVSYELSDTDRAKGVQAILAAEDGSLALTISLAALVDTEGNQIVTLEGLSEFYAENGVVEQEIAFFNDLPGLYYVLTSPVVYGNLAFVTEEGYVLTFSIISNGTEEMMGLADVMLFSVCAVDEE